jgi:hypothetical protein
MEGRYRKPETMRDSLLWGMLIVYVSLLEGMFLGLLYLLGLGISFNRWFCLYGVVLTALPLAVAMIWPSLADEPFGCGLLLGILFVALLASVGVAYGLLPESWMDHAEGLFAVLALLWPASLSLMLIRSYYYQCCMSPLLQQDLGFRYVKRQEQITVTDIQPGGVFDQAGFKEWDVVVDRVSITGFFRKLEQARGKGPITLTVVPWSDTQPIRERPRRTLTFQVPPRTAA